MDFIKRLVPSSRVRRKASLISPPKTGLLPAMIRSCPQIDRMASKRDLYFIENVLDESKRSYTVFPIKDTSKSKAAQDFTDPVMKDQIGLTFHPGLSLVDDDQVLSVVDVGQLGGGAHLQGSASYDEAVGAADQVNGALIGFFREEFPVEGNIGADQLATGGIPE